MRKEKSWCNWWEISLEYWMQRNYKWEKHILNFQLYIMNIYTWCQLGQWLIPNWLCNTYLYFMFIMSMSNLSNLSSPSRDSSYTWCSKSTLKGCHLIPSYEHSYPSVLEEYQTCKSFDSRPSHDFGRTNLKCPFRNDLGPVSSSTTPVFLKRQCVVQVNEPQVKHLLNHCNTFNCFFFYVFCVGTDPVKENNSER